MAMSLLKDIESRQQRKDLPKFNVGDTVRVFSRIKEGEKERVQYFEGIVIGFHRNAVSTTFKVRKESYGVGVERTYPIHSPLLEKIEVKEEGRRPPREALLPARKVSGKKGAHPRERKDMCFSKKGIVVPSERGRRRSPCRGSDRPPPRRRRRSRRRTVRRLRGDRPRPGVLGPAAWTEAGGRPLAGPGGSPPPSSSPGAFRPGDPRFREALPPRQRERLDPVITCGRRGVRGRPRHSGRDRHAEHPARLPARHAPWPVDAPLLPSNFLFVDGNRRRRVRRAARKRSSRGTYRRASTIAAAFDPREGVAGPERRRSTTCAHPGYGLRGTRGTRRVDHLAAIRRLGPSPIHRRTFRGVVV